MSNQWGIFIKILYILFFMKKAFVFTDEGNPHHIRTKEIIQKHPEVKKLVGKNSNTLFVIIGLVALQIGLACLIAEQSWLVIFLTAYLIGAFVNHGLFVMIHECGHRLLFKNTKANRLAGILANIPQVVPNSVSFERYHSKHHSGQGVYELDGDLPSKWEAKLIDNYFIGKVIWLLFYPFFQLFRLPRLKEVKVFDGWIILNWGVQIVFVISVLVLIGPKALGFLLMSFFFSVGLHPLGARWIQEHYLTHGKQETYSYYGVLNTVAFNVGYHNEHHDFPSVPWNRLPKIKEAAPLFYNTLFYHKSLIKLFFRFLFDKELSLYSRLVRQNRKKVTPTNSEKSLFLSNHREKILIQ